MMPTIKAIVDQGLIEKDLRYLFDNGPRVGMHFVARVEYAYLGNKINEVPKHLQGKCSMVYDRYEIDGSNVFDKPYNNRGARLVSQMKSTCMIAKLLNLKSLRMIGR